ncbi:type IV pilus biogenesis protein PilP [Salmonella enterica]|nr:type IV pilus biogenesis protein PilP [Salmonella enterica]
MLKVINKREVFISAIMILLFNHQLYADISVPKTPATLLQLERIQAETVIYEAQLAREKALSEIRQVGNDPLSHTNTASLDSSISRRTSSSLPRVLEIYGTTQNMTARLSLQDGSKVDVTSGQTIPGTGYKVSSITSGTVFIQDGDNKIELVL